MIKNPVDYKIKNIKRKIFYILKDPIMHLVFTIKTFSVILFFFSDDYIRINNIDFNVNLNLLLSLPGFGWVV